MPVPKHVPTAALLPLAGVRILDFCEERGQSCGRLLADLGAEVILVEPPTGSPARRRPPFHGATSLHFAVHAANKRSVTVDLASESGRTRLSALLHTADLLIDGTARGFWAQFGLDYAWLQQQKPDILILSITDFGLSGPYSHFLGSEAVHAAMGTFLSRSGREGREPLLPPGEMLSETAAAQATWVALLAYWQRLRTGRGDVLDFSINDAVAQILDPGIGVSGSASAGKTPIETAPHGRPIVDAKPGRLPSIALMYPIFKCADGAVRICVLNPRQWQAMSEWLGPDHPFRHPRYGKPGARLMQITRINALIAHLFAHQARAALMAEGRRRGIPIAELARPSELLSHPHFVARDFFAEVAVDGEVARGPAGYWRIDGHRVGWRTPAPCIGRDNDTLMEPSARAASAQDNTLERRRPFEGLRVLDLGVIVAGGELGRLFADQGAQVIKVENRAYADGLRQSLDGNPVSISFAQASRGKLSLGLNLRSAKGVELFGRLVAESDVVLTNFKPGTTESLGIDYATLRKINPRIICAESSAMGSFGPEAKTMGYGPLVRASTALTRLWRYPDAEDAYGDGITIFPDHFVARVSAIAILAKLIERESTGVGGFVDVAQAECIMNMLATEFLHESIAPGSMVAKGNRNDFDAPHAVFRCRGDDEWCVIAVKSDEHWQGLCAAMDRADLAARRDLAHASGRLAHRDELEGIVQTWCAGRSPREVRDRCQLHGAPAGNMLRLSEFLDDPHFRARRFFRVLDQPTAGRPLPTENGPVAFASSLPDPDIRRAPAMGEHTTQIARDVLRVSDGEIKSLLRSGDLEQGPSAAHGARLQKYKTFAASTAMKGLLAYNAWRAKRQ